MKIEPIIVNNINDKEINNPIHKVLGSPNKVGLACSVGITTDVKVNIDKAINSILQIVQILFFISLYILWYYLLLALLTTVSARAVADYERFQFVNPK